MALAGDPELASRLAEARRRLVETGTRNRLVHVNRAQRRANALDIVHERADAVFAQLRREGRRLRFAATGRDRAPAGAAAGSHAAETPAEAPVAAPDPARAGDRLLDTPLGPEALRLRLLRLQADARLAEEEQGVNLLHLAIGFLTWFEAPDSAVPRTAPLVLLPVSLLRNDRGAGFDLAARDEDIVTNLPLQARLKADFGMRLPEIDEDEAWTPGAYFDRVAATVADMKGWGIDRDGMQLGFFSFAKLLMLRDLDPAHWPGAGLTDHAMIRSLLRDGFAADAPLFGPDERLDDRLDPAALVHIVDADASQTRVIEEVRAGRDLVVQGPPGTGKSQTIANILAAAAHDGKTVLFVAEKRAALDVVHGRMMRAGLGDLCLQLHARGASRKAVLQELARTLSAAARAPADPGDPAPLRATRDALNAIADLLHRPLPGSDDSPFRALADLVWHLGSGRAPPALEADAGAALSAAARKAVVRQVEAFARAVADHGRRPDHPLRGVTRLDLQPTERARCPAEIAALHAALVALRAARASLADLDPGAATPGDLAGARAIAARLALLARLPPGFAALAPGLAPHVGDPALAPALAAGAAWAVAEAAESAQFVPLAWTAPAAAWRAPLAAGVSSLWSRLFGGWRAASAGLAGLLRGTLPATPAARLALLDRLLAVQDLRLRAERHAPMLAAVFGAGWRDGGRDFAAAEACRAWLADFAATGMAVPDAAGVAAVVARAPGAAALGAALDAAIADAEQARDRIRARLGLTADTGAPDDAADLDALGATLDRIAAGLDRYPDWVALTRAAAALIAAGLDGWVAALDSGQLAPADAVDEFLFALAEARWRRARAARPELDALATLDRHALVATFRDLERTRLDQARQTIRARHLGQLPRGAVGPMGFLLGEIAKRRGHRPIRQLIAAAGEMVQRIKPVFLMSPITVAQFLPPGAIGFDLLVIDEASQIRPEDALGAAARARQIVVVGDQKQLPPTSFFDRLAEDLPEDDPEEIAAAAEGPAAPASPRAALAGEMESILTLCAARGLPDRMLEWHYRSRDPSLIAVSNAEFYDGRLILPPSPLQRDPEFGLRFVRVDGVYSSRSRGGGRPGTNRVEAEAVVARLAAQARTRPDASVGVVAFSKAQSDLLTELLEAARRRDPVLDAFLREGKTEDVFVKNIESVQGDERDTILISVGYGPHEPGGRLAAMQFGPVNAEGGERRLNVLFTRARARCEVFASFDPGDIDPARARGAGPRVLRRFLDFAQRGVLDAPAPTGGRAESPFEADVARVVAGLGYPADPQVGSAGFRIDLAVRHPERPGQYVLAVECDGAAWHRALWARERDRLRQEVLEGLGWRVHRIWSTDWFHRRDAEVARLTAALAAAARAAEAGTLAPPGANDGDESPATAAPDQESEPEDPDPGGAATLAIGLRAPPYRRATLPTRSEEAPHLVPTSRLADLACAVVEIEGPVHTDEVARRIAAAFSKARAGGRIRAAAETGLTLARRQGRLEAEGGFWMTAAQRAAPPIRDRAGETAPTTHAASLSPLEIRAAADWIRRESGAMPVEDLARAVLRVLGFARAGRDLLALVRNALDA
jgi:hypothetical protein